MLLSEFICLKNIYVYTLKSLISWNTRERMFSFQISLLVVTFPSHVWCVLTLMLERLQPSFFCYTTWKPQGFVHSFLVLLTLWIQFYCDLLTIIFVCWIYLLSWAALHLKAGPIPFEVECMKFQPLLGWRLASTTHYNKIITRIDFSIRKGLWAKKPSRFNKSNIIQWI